MSASEMTPQQYADAIAALWQEYGDEPDSDRRIAIRNEIGKLSQDAWRAIREGQR